MEKATKKEPIRSEITHAQEVSMIHSAPSQELIENIKQELKALEKRSKNAKKQE